ncbi:MAG: phosphoribosylamine--glycine ligase [Flavobacteriales bacterium]|nr:phosphoribosylamine--glycine ligase [Flavobacteriales bacterium]
MNVLILGSGGREHAFAWKIAQSKRLTKLYVAPGNAGTAMIAENVPISVNEFEKIKKLVIDQNIQMVLVGPEDPLVNGIYDYFQNDILLKNIVLIGPSKVGAQLEGSKDFAKAFMQRHNIPTANYKSFTANDLTEAYSFLENSTPPYVLKADGLAAGKGVLILTHLDEAKNELKNMLHGKFGEAGNTVVIEEFLDGIELSVFVLTDGKNHLLLPEAKDYKRIGEGDTGLNTGGMGAVSPVSFADKTFLKKVEEQVIIPTIFGLQKENIDYNGFVFFGLINVKGEPYVIEYNCRMGDPETEVVIPRIKNDILELFLALANNTLDLCTIDTDERIATTVIAVSGGYPEEYEKNKEIIGLNSVTESIVFHSGTTLVNQKIQSNGGRVLAVTSLGKNKNEALEKSYNSLSKIHFEKMYFRKDIGFDL